MHTEQESIINKQRTHRPLPHGHIQPDQTQLHNSEVRKFDLEHDLYNSVVEFVLVFHVIERAVLPTVPWSLLRSLRYQRTIIDYKTDNIGLISTMFHIEG